MIEKVIEVNHLSKSFGRKMALRDLSFELGGGGIHAVIGSNGAGKTTLFRILLGLLSPSGGSSRVLGIDSQKLTPEIRGRIALVHEEHTLPDWMTVARLTRMQRELFSGWCEGVYREVLGYFQVSGEQKVAQLSRGERAGLNLSLALAQDPDLLILDEPTLGLDVVAKQAFIEALLFTGVGEERTTIYCSHQMDEIERVAENLVILEQGEMVSSSSPEEFCGRISSWIAEFPEGASGLRSRVPGLLQHREIDGQHHLVILDEAEGFAHRMESQGARGLQRASIGFDRAVNAFLTRNHHAPSA